MVMFHFANCNSHYQRVHLQAFLVFLPFFSAPLVCRNAVEKSRSGRCPCGSRRSRAFFGFVPWIPWIAWNSMDRKK